jgi:hypothetical protein
MYGLFFIVQSNIQDERRGDDPIRAQRGTDMKPRRSILLLDDYVRALWNL